MAFIYTLSDPRTGELRYVGQTAESVAVRVQKHCWPSTLVRDGGCHRTHWLKQLAASGLKPVGEMLEEVPAGQVNEAEKFWIAQFRALGFRLVNTTDGGDGTTKGHKFGPMSEEHKRKISEGVKRNPPKHPRQKPVVDQNGTVYSSVTKAARSLNLHKKNVFRVLNGTQRQTGGYAFNWA